MDEYNRASTALVSNNNTVNIPCRNSNTLNKIIATIPTSQRAPSWATRYKFVLKPDRTTYETIYSSIFINDPNSNNTYLLLEGDNIAKVEEGDRLIVKRDVDGVSQSCIYATVLEKTTESADFIKPSSGNPVPGGTYMKMSTPDFSAVESASDVINFGLVRAAAIKTNRYPVAYYKFYTSETDSASTPVTTNTNYNVPIGTRIIMKIGQERKGTGGKCEERTSVLEKTFVSDNTYADMYAWFVGENIANVIENEAITFSGTPADPVNNIVISGLYTDAGEALATGAAVNNGTESHLYTVFAGQSNSPQSASDLLLNNYYRFYQNTTDNTYSLLVSGTRACRNNDPDGASTSGITFTVFRRDSVIVFETEPQEALPDVWYENDQSYSIDSLGNHSGNVTNQNISTGVAGVVNTEFFNCFAFGNGVESYKIRDALNGKSFNLGNRVFSTSNIDYKEAHRFADLTYSGVYNNETNVNKLNEFNLGLANFKPLEESYGDVEILYGRRTDILVLQEDKISYVLASKNIISDSTGGGLVASIPEILGNQIARIENYGISNNPESFVAWGENKYFTDVKRGAVLQLIGGSMSDERLIIISETGMRSWFRDLFTSAFTTQKLGGYDPYMAEYVLTSNKILKPEIPLCIACGVTKDITVIANKDFVYCVDVTEQTGLVTISYVIPQEGEQDIESETSVLMTDESGNQLITEGSQSQVGYTIKAIYKGVIYTSGSVTASGSFTFDKNVPNVQEVTIVVSSDSNQNDTIQINVSCPKSDALNVYNICVTDPLEAGQFIHNEFSWTDGTTNSPIESNLVEFGSTSSSFAISQYQLFSGPQEVEFSQLTGLT